MNEQFPYGFKEIFKLYSNYALSEFIFWTIIVVGAFSLCFAYHILKRYYKNKKGNNKN